MEGRGGGGTAFSVVVMEESRGAGRYVPTVATGVVLSACCVGFSRRVRSARIGSRLLSFLLTWYFAQLDVLFLPIPLVCVVPVLCLGEHAREGGVGAGVKTT